MNITFQLGGQERKIRWDGVQYTAYAPNDALLGHYTVFGNAVLAHVKEVARVDGDLGVNQELLTIKEYVKRFERLVNDLRSIEEHQIPTLRKTESKPDKPLRKQPMTITEANRPTVGDVVEKDGQEFLVTAISNSSDIDDFDDL